MYQTLEIERHNRVATVWMNRPDVHNAFDEALIAELTAALPNILRLAQAMRELDACNWLDEDPCDSSTLTLAKREARAALVAIAPTA